MKALKSLIALTAIGCGISLPLPEYTYDTTEADTIGNETIELRVASNQDELLMVMYEMSGSRITTQFDYRIFENQDGTCNREEYHTLIGNTFSYNFENVMTDNKCDGSVDNYCFACNEEYHSQTRNDFGNNYDAIMSEARNSFDVIFDIDTQIELWHDRNKPTQ